MLDDVSGTFLQSIPIDVWNQAFGGSTVLDRARILDEPREKGWDLARVAWIIQGGQCDEHASVVKYLLNEAGVKNVTILRSNSPHAFPVVNLAPGADPGIPWTWGKDAFIADSWYQIAVSRQKDCTVTLKFNNNEIRGKASKAAAELPEKVTGALSSARLVLEGSGLKVTIEQSLGGGGTVTSEGVLKK